MFPIFSSFPLYLQFRRDWSHWSIPRVYLDALGSLAAGGESQYAPWWVLGGDNLVQPFAGQINLPALGAELPCDTCVQVDMHSTGRGGCACSTFSFLFVIPGMVYLAMRRCCLCHALAMRRYRSSWWTLPALPFMVSARPKGFCCNPFGFHSFILTGLRRLRTPGGIPGVGLCCCFLATYTVAFLQLILLFSCNFSWPFWLKRFSRCSRSFPVSHCIYSSAGIDHTEVYLGYTWMPWAP